MFDRHLHMTERGSQYVTVTEKRAPTDESVRLLKEMEQAARDKVIQSIRLENCPIDCVIHAQESAIDMRLDYLILTKINGRRLEVRKSFGMDVGGQAVADGLLLALSEVLAAALLGPAFKALPRHLRPAQ